MAHSKTSNTPPLMQSQIAYLYKNIGLSFWSNIILSCVLAAVLWSRLDHLQTPLLIWLGLAVSVALVKLLMGTAFDDDIVYTQQELQAWSNKHIFFASALSTIWGLAGLFLFPHALTEQVFLILILFSVILTYIPLLAASRIAFYSQMSLVLLPILLWMSLSNFPNSAILILGTAIMAIILLLVAGYIHAILHQLQSAQQKLVKQANTDPLTQIANRRHFDKVFRHEWRRATRYGDDISMLMIDVDDFKMFNDTQGHQQGDECLIAVASALSTITRRPADIAARFGGEEFAVLLPNTDKEDTLMLAERLRKNVEKMQIKHPATERGIVTISIGATTCSPIWNPDDDQVFDESEDHDVVFPMMLISSADNALYLAKRTGKNRVESQNCGDHKLAEALQKQESLQQSNLPSDLD